MLLACDDTDSREGGCTTQLAFHILLALPELALTGMPRLVRLNPNVPWKTRGNGAIALPLGKPVGPSVRVGELRGMEVLAFPEARPVEPTDEVLERIWDVVRKQAQPGALPAVACVAEPAPAAAYWQAVRTLVTADEARIALDGAGALHRETGEGRALVGCLGALAWPGPASSYEFLAYRHPSRWGTPREVSGAHLMGLDASGATFHTTEDDRVVSVPHGPDPVLIGLRGRDPETLMAAALRTLPFACQEPIDGWLMWATNQASGDHVTPVDALAEAPELGTVAATGTVTTMPETRNGGHTFVALEDAAGMPFQAVAFEPTKDLRDTVRLLRPGDRVTVVGAFREGVVRLEKLRVDHVAAHQVPAPTPVCPTCGRTLKSAGAGQGLRCRHCGTKGHAAAGTRDEPRELQPGWHEVPVGARRHLHRPIAWGDR